MPRACQRDRACAKPHREAPNAATPRQNWTHIPERPSSPPQGFVERSHKAWAPHFMGGLAKVVQFLTRRWVLLKRGRTRSADLCPAGSFPNKAAELLHALTFPRLSCSFRTGGVSVSQVSEKKEHNSSEQAPHARGGA